MSSPVKSQTFGVKRRVALLLWVMLLLGGLGVWVQDEFGLLIRKAVDIPSKAVQSMEGGAFSVSGPLRPYLAVPVHPAIHLKEDGTAIREKASSSLAVRNASRPTFAFSQRQLWFRTTDGTDPRTNGRHYVAVFPQVVSERVRQLTLMVSGVAALGLLWTCCGARLLSGGRKLMSHCWSLTPRMTGRMTGRLRMTNWRTLPERAAVAALAFTFYIPIILFAASKGDEKFKTLPYVRNSTLHGITSPSLENRFSSRSLFDGSWTQSLSSWFDAAHPGREALVRTTAEMWYRLFRQTALPNTTIKLGTDDSLYEQGYLTEYHLFRTSREQLLPFVQDLKRLQDECLARGMGFIFLLTPSKADQDPSHHPTGWIGRTAPGTRAVNLLPSMLREYGIFHVNGVALTKDLQARSAIPTFPKGGIHWAPHSALESSKAAILELQQQGVHVKPIVTGPERPAEDPTGEEKDLLSLMNLLIPWKYPVVDVDIQRQGSKDKGELKLCCVGGSFSYKTCFQMAATGHFREVCLWFYYSESRVFMTPYEEKFVKLKDSAASLAPQVLDCDVLLLEANTAVLDFTGPVRLRQFMKDALVALAAKPNRDPWPQFATAVPCAWGQALQFGTSGPVAEQVLGNNGFHHVEADASALLGQPTVLSIQFPSPVGSHKMSLELDMSVMAAPSNVAATLEIRSGEHALADVPLTPSQHQKVHIPISLEHFKRGTLLDLEFHLKGVPNTVNVKFHELRIHRS